MKTKSKWIQYVLCLYIFLVPVMPNNIKLNILHKTINIPSAGNIFLTLIIVIFIITIIKNFNMFLENLHSFVLNPLSDSMLVLFGIMLVSVLYASYKRIAISESTRFLSFILLYFIVKYNIDKRQIKGFINCFFLIFSFINIYGIVQKVTGLGILKGYAIVGTNVLRTNGTFDNPNTFAAFLILGMFPAVMMIVSSNSNKKKIAYGIISIMTLCNIVFTGSRSAELSLIVGFLALSIIYNKYIVIVLAVIGAILSRVPLVRVRFIQIGNKSIDQGRIYLWKTALKMIENHPILGVGNGNYQPLYDSYVQKYKELKYLDYSYFPTHNNYLKIESELGVVGGVSFIAIIIGSLVKVKGLINVLEDKKLKLFYIGFFATMASFFFMNIFENLFTVPEVAAYFWIFLAAADGLLHRKSDYIY